MDIGGMRIAAWIALAAGAVTTYLLFMLRYGWYISPAQARLLNISLGLFAVVCCIAWFAKPSKILVISGYALLFAGPAVYDSKHFVAPDLHFLPFLSIGVMPLVAGIELRRRTWRQKVQ